MISFEQIRDVTGADSSLRPEILTRPEFESPVLKREERFGDIFDFYVEARQSFWTPGEIDLKRDVEDWAVLTDEERNTLTNVLAFFATSENIVANNLIENFCTEMTVKAARAFYAIQLAIETIHSEMYTILISVLVDEDKQDAVFNGIKTMKGVGMKADWVARWTDPKKAALSERVLAFAITEGIFFSASFAVVFWMKNRGLMPGTGASNELISRDEALHFTFAQLLYNKYIVNLPSDTIVREMIRSAVETEKAFVREAMPVNMPGMNADIMCDYVEFVANKFYQSLKTSTGSLDYLSVDNRENPLPFMDAISQSGKTNFFDRRNTEYRKASPYLK